MSRPRQPAEVPVWQHVHDVKRHAAWQALRNMLLAWAARLRPTAAVSRESRCLAAASSGSSCQPSPSSSCGRSQPSAAGAMAVLERATAVGDALWLLASVPVPCMSDRAGGRVC